MRFGTAYSADQFVLAVDQSDTVRRHIVTAWRRVSRTKRSLWASEGNERVTTSLSRVGSSVAECPCLRALRHAQESLGGDCSTAAA
jgi:hypothetical protein